MRINGEIEQVPDEKSMHEEKSMQDCAINNYCRLFGIQKGCATIHQVKESSAGILGWAAYDGPGIPFEKPALYPNKIPQAEIKARREEKKKVPADPYAHFMSAEGQQELLDMINERQRKKKEEAARGGLSVMEFANPQCLHSMPVAFDGWIEVEFTADTGACDTVVPKDGPLSSIAIVPSPSSERGLLYEVANKQTIPCLGERRLEVWTESASHSRAMAVSVADVHKPLLSLGKCADAGYESRFGPSAGCLIDTNSGEILPFQRRGNLYYLKMWVRQAPNDSPFGGPR